MSRGIFINIVRFVLLVLVQVLVFNRLNFFGYINPMVYIMFLYWYPIKENRALFIGLSFLLGISVDLFSDTMAIHTAATTTIAYLRPFIMRFVFGINYEFVINCEKSVIYWCCLINFVFIVQFFVQCE